MWKCCGCGSVEDHHQRVIGVEKFRSTVRHETAAVFANVRLNRGNEVLQDSPADAVELKAVPPRGLKIAREVR